MGSRFVHKKSKKTNNAFMSERVTIGGTTYEALGSSSSNLLLKCNGTARIQWGSKLIDLIKDGKIAQGDSQDIIEIISDESQMSRDGIYILSKEESIKILLYKDNQEYDLLGTDLYISASNKQEITVEQQKQALENLGIYFNTLVDFTNSGIQNGIAYISEKKTLYLINDGVVTEFKPKTQSVTVEGNEEQENTINGSTQSISETTSGLSAGMIIMHSTSYIIPQGWELCDGNNNTPDLSNQFILKPQTDVQTIEEISEEISEENTEQSGGEESGEDVKDETTNSLQNKYLVVYIMKQ